MKKEKQIISDVKVYTTGVFDILHPGHLKLLQQASKMGDLLIVGVQDDDSVREQKGRYPVMSCSERISILKTLPFVSDVIEYSGTDQRPILKKLKPHIMVQGDDWLTTSDRKDILNYLKKNKIELKLLPYTKGISSSQIKTRVLERYSTARNDIDVLLKKIKILEIDSLSAYEQSDPKRVKRLIKKIKSDGVFTDPITVALFKGSHIIVDGANRVNALKMMGIRRVLANVVQYDDLSQIELYNNAHFLDIEPSKLFKIFETINIPLVESDRRTAQKNMIDEEVAALIQIGERIYVVRKSSSLEENAQQVNHIVASYIGKHKVNRLSELSQDNASYKCKITFQKFAVKDIVELVNKKLTLESGITWHKIHSPVIRVNVPLKLLRKNLNITAVQKAFENIILSKIEKQKIRYYPHGVYVCDEW